LRRRLDSAVGGAGLTRMLPGWAASGEFGSVSVGAAYIRVMLMRLVLPCRNGWPRPSKPCSTGQRPLPDFLRSLMVLS
jgi:hypothetical protein